MIDKLLDEIERLLKAHNKTPADLARELTSKKFPNGRSYNQVYDWLRPRRFNPSGVALLELQAWRDRNAITKPNPIDVVVFGKLK